MAVDTQQLHGFDELSRKLREIPLAMKKKVLRNALAAGGRLVRDEARRLAPTLTEASARKNLHRRRGTVRKAITVRTSKIARRRGDVGVFVNVKPLKSSQIRAFKGTAARAGGKGSGALNPNDPYYWQWLEFGRSQRAASGARSRVGRISFKRAGKTVVLVQGLRARRGKRAVGALPKIRFLQRSARMLRPALDIFKVQLDKWLVKTNATGRVVP